MSADTAWIRTGFEMAGRQVGVTVRRLDPDEQQRVAAEIAWFAEDLSVSARSAAGWPAVLERILLHDVSITLDDAQWPADRTAWDLLACRAFEAFVRANHLDAAIRRHLDSAHRQQPS